MKTARMATYFAPAEVASKEIIEDEHRYISSLEFAVSALEAIPQIVFVLNRYRQVVFANAVFNDTFKVEKLDEALGFRMGEAFDCIYACEAPSGCGTTKHCESCGAVLAILDSLDGNKKTNECRIARKPGLGALDLLVTATPFMVESGLFTIVSAVDISHEKRRRVLERVFFHDVINIAGGIGGLSEVLFDSLGEEAGEEKDLARIIYEGCSDLMEEIYAQKDISSAESNELTVKPSQIDLHEFLQALGDLYKRHPVAKGRNIKIVPSAYNVGFESDATLLRRVLGNLVKNALEASGDDETVTLGCNAEDDHIEFWIHNTIVIPEDVQRQIFQRSFSTKGSGRGVGTYSVKLLTEAYLNGSASFTSSTEDGTVFHVRLPLSFESCDVS